MTNKSCVVFVINSIRLGGAERALVNILGQTHLQEGLDVHVLLLDNEPMARELPSHVRLTILDCKGSTLKSIKGINEYIKKTNPSVVASFLVRANLSNAIVRMFLKKHKALLFERMHLTSHLDNQFKGLKRHVAGLLPKAFYRFADAIVGVSNGVTIDLVENYSVTTDKAYTIFNPYDLEFISKKCAIEPEFELPDSFIISTGRLTPAKNFKLLIDAYLKSDESAHLCILGDGEQKQELLDYIYQQNASNKVTLLGYAENPFSILVRAKYYISASNNEGFPNALVEAMAIGLPAIMTNCPSGPAEILAADVNFHSDKVHIAKYGILAPLDNRVELTHAINLFQNEALRKEYKAMSLKRAKDFHINKVAEQYWSFIRTQLE